jgi:hypothetical protein
MIFSDDARHRSAIPITVRQLEAVVRISESLSKMQLTPFVTERHVDEALRLFQVSTIAAAQSGNLAGKPFHAFLCSISFSFIACIRWDLYFFIFYFVLVMHSW